MRAAVDATGFETRHISRHYARRCGRLWKYRRWPKLTAVLEAGSHLFLAARVTRGPGQDSPQFRPAARASAKACPIDTLLGDGGYDAEHDHAYCRGPLGIRRALFRRNRPSHGRERPKTELRRQMVGRSRRDLRRSRYRRFDGQRWRIESGFSRQKRPLGSALRARAWASQKREILPRAMTHNLMLLAAEGFDRAREEQWSRLVVGLY